MNEISTDSTADHSIQRQPNLTTNGIAHSDTADNNSAFILMDPDSDIETDAAPDAPRPRGTPIPDPPKPNNNFVNEEPSTEDIPNMRCFSKGRANGGNFPGGSAKNRIPRGPANVRVYNIVQSQGVHVGTTFQVHIEPKNGKKEEEVSPPKYYEILMSSVKTVSDDHLDCVAAKIGKNWEKLGKLLGLNDAAIYRANEDYKNNFREKVYQLLLEWKQGTGGPNQAALLSRLSLSLWQLREKDALDGLVELENDPRLIKK